MPNACQLHIRNFLTAGKINDPQSTRPEVHAKFKALTEELGKLWEQNETKYDQHIQHNPCPYLDGKTCTIYAIRPDGCRLYPNTVFGRESKDCQALNRFKKQKAALKKGKRAKETYHHIAASQEQTAKLIKSTKCTQKQYQTCITKLRQAGMTDNELILFHYFNCKNKD